MATLTVSAFQVARVPKAAARLNVNVASSSRVFAAGEWIPDGRYIAALWNSLDAAGMSNTTKLTTLQDLSAHRVYRGDQCAFPQC